MGGMPQAVGNAVSNVGSSVGGAAKSFWGAAKEGLNDNYVQPWKSAISDMRGNPQTADPARPAPDPGAQAPPAQAPPPSTPHGTAMQSFFNAPAVETPAMRLRRMQQQQA